MKKGFTLIELLGVLVIIGVLAIITQISISTIFANSKNNLYNEQVERIKNSAKLWVIENSELVVKNNVYYVTLDELTAGDFLEDKDIYDPRDNSVMNGCVKVTYTNGDFSYLYDENCNK